MSGLDAMRGNILAVSADADINKDGVTSGVENEKIGPPGTFFYKLIRENMSVDTRVVTSGRAVVTVPEFNNRARTPQLNDEIISVNSAFALPEADKKLFIDGRNHATLTYMEHGRVINEGLNGVLNWRLR